MGRLYFLTTTYFDPGATARLKEVLAEAGSSRPLLVTDRGVVAAGLVDHLYARSGLAALPQFEETPGNPDEAAVMKALAVYRESGADGVVALGGGSSIDLGKAVALLAHQPGPLSRYDDLGGAGTRPIGPAVAPLVALPTTAGTGSEVGRAAVISTNPGPGERARKLIVRSSHLLPRVSLADPELTLGLPPAITAGSGMDAFAHCLEGFLAPNDNPPAAAVALDGMARIWRALPRAMADGSDLEARSAMMMGSLEGGMSMANGLGAVHALSHALGALHDLQLHHGTLNAVVLPAVLRFNRPAVGGRYPRVLAALGLPETADLAEEIAAFNARLGLPPGLAAMGVTEDLLPGLAPAAAGDATSRTNPRPATAEDYRGLLEAAL